MAFAMMDFDEEDHKKISIGNLLMIEELEEIKKEFEDKILLNQTVALQIMDKHIKKLKGE